MNTAIATLPRIDRLPSVNIPDLQELSDKFKELLGYKGMEKYKYKLQHNAEVAEFCNALIDMGCAPFKAKAIESYKYWAQFKAQLKYNVFEGNVGLFYTLIVCIVMFIPSLLYIVYGGGTPGVGLDGFAFGVTMISGICGLASLGFAAFTESYYTFHWTNSDLEAYEQPVPVAVLELATQIKERFPDVDFQVESLERQHVVKDPFLVVTKNGTAHFIAVWDEPTFNG